MARLRLLRPLKFMKTYQAPWGKTLIWSSGLLVAFVMTVAVGIPYMLRPVLSLTSSGPHMGILTAHRMDCVAATLYLGWVGPLVVLACLPFMVRGYGITDDAILIRRLFWTTRLRRADLRSAEIIPRAMKGSLRTFGNGGAFSFTGWYWNRSLGGYRAYVTDLNRTVVLRFWHRTVVISPGDPENFVNDLTS